MTEELEIYFAKKWDKFVAEYVDIQEFKQIIQEVIEEQRNACVAAFQSITIEELNQHSIISNEQYKKYVGLKITRATPKEYIGTEPKE